MSIPKPTITVAVDATNPGQFFACCGLLELADRLWPGAEGWFADGKFIIAGGGTLREVLQALIARQPEVLTTLPNGLAVTPLLAPLRLSLGDGPGQQLILDAWTTVRIDRGEVIVGPNRPWNFWSGRQTSAIIWGKLRTALTNQLGRLVGNDLPGVFNERVLLTGRFGFDPGPAWNALDIGFSLNDQGIEVQSSAAVELLAQVGLQRTRPVMAPDRTTFNYSTWGGPLSPAVTPAAAAGQLTIPPTSRYRGYIVDRGQYAALGYSTPLSGVADE